MESKNFKRVKVKEHRVCAICKNHISKGSDAITINRPFCGRKWVHIGCSKKLTKKKEVKEFEKCETFNNLQRTRATMGALPFGDEGAYLACHDYIGKLLEECEGCKLECPYKI